MLNTVHCTMWKSTVNCDHAQKISWNQLFSNFFSKNVDLTEKMLIFSVKSWSRFITLFHTVKLFVMSFSNRTYQNFVKSLSLHISCSKFRKINKIQCSKNQQAIDFLHKNLQILWHKTFSVNSLYFFVFFWISRAYAARGGSAILEAVTAERDSTQQSEGPQP